MASHVFTFVVIVIIVSIATFRPSVSKTVTIDDAHHASQDYRLFEVYGPSDRIEVAREKLDGLGIILDAGPGADAWLFSYAGKHACVGEATLRAKAIQTYLMGKNVDRQRIKIVNSGFKEEWSVELWIVIRGKKARPVTNPTVKPSKVHFDLPSTRCTASSFDLS